MLELIFHRSYLLAASVVTYSQPPTVRSLHPSPLHSCETFERAVALSVPADCSSPVIPEGSGSLCVRLSSRRSFTDNDYGVTEEQP